MIQIFDSLKLNFGNFDIRLSSPLTQDAAKLSCLAYSWLLENVRIHKRSSVAATAVERTLIGAKPNCMLNFD